ncbi:MAG: LTA synthase family protein, partial [Deltaproteobacteria bacterium]|nr:LTA synthase family protein [Deltaproteobacteria bacterium]
GFSRSRLLVKALLGLLLAWYIALLVYLFVDVQYFAFSQRHLTFELSNTWKDTGVILKIGASKYLFEFLGFTVLLVLFSYIFIKLTAPFRRLEARKGILLGLALDALAFLIIVAVSVVSVRGGVQMKPLGTKNAFMEGNTVLGFLNLNGIYTTFDTIYNSKDNSELLAFLESNNSGDGRDVAARMISSEKEENSPGYPLYRNFKYASGERKEMNVVLFIMESWSAKFIGSLGGKIDAAPYFTSLSDKGLLLTSCFANAQRSYEGLTATIGSIPMTKGMSFEQGGLLFQTSLEPIGEVFSNYGYDTIFVHGARPGSMGFDGLVKKLGIKRHISRNDFQDIDRVDDGTWGIFDEYSFLRAHEEFEKLDRPFFAVVYSLSSHTPYKLPSGEFEHFDSSVPFRDFLNSMRYSDYALQKFFEKAKDSRYFDNTLFIVIADHTEGMSTADNIYESYRIPCFFYAPGMIKPARYDGLASQLDVVPTVYDMLKVSDKHTSWGKSIFSPGKRQTILPRGDMFVWVNEPYMLVTNLYSPLGLYNFKLEPKKNLLSNGAAGAETKKLNNEVLNYIKLSYELILDNRVRPNAPL